MNATSQVKNNVYSGLDISAEVNAPLHTATTNVSSRKQSLKALNKALKKSPDQLHTLVKMYKFYFNRGDIGKAEEIVFQTLVKASLKGGFSNDWRELSITSTDWSDPAGAGRIFLSSLKALALIRVRQDMRRDARKILRTLKRLDPHDQVGAYVIRDLLEGLSEN
jgi:hypothetical protein